MANGRGGDSRKKRDTGRDPGGFVALPWRVLDSAAYMGLSPTAKALLLEVARQFTGDDNGRMLLSRVYMATRGWYSAGAIHQAKAELLAAQLVFETAKGARPNKAGWYAVTWRKLDKIPGFDLGAAAAFEQGAYLKVAAKEKRPPPKCKNPKRNASLDPAHGTESAAIGPAHGTEGTATVPAHGPMEAVFEPVSVPPAGHPLEKPSACAGSGATEQTTSKGKPGPKPKTHYTIGGKELPRIPCTDACGECGADAGHVHVKGCALEPCPLHTAGAWKNCKCGHEAVGARNRVQFRSLVKSKPATAEAAA